jgi:hypothetical protein
VKKTIYIFLYATLSLILITANAQGEGKAINFDGKDDYIVVPSSPSLNPQKQITIEFWIKITKTTNEWSPIIHKGGSYGSKHKNREYSVWLNKKPHFHLASAGDKAGQHRLNSNKIQTGKWVFFSATIDRVKHFMKIYINGKLDAELKDTYYSFNNNNFDLRFGWGEERQSNYSPFCGILDDIRIFKCALSPEEIQASMDRELTGNEDDLVLYYNFNELTSDGKVKDLSSFGNHGIIHGGAKLVNSYAPLEPSRPSQAFPPDLVLENLRFNESSGNQALDGLETGNIQFDLVNKGRGNANNIEIKITPLTSGRNLSFNTTTKFSKIYSKSRENVHIPITADIDVQSLSRQFRIEVTEVYGFDADPAIITFDTQALVPLDLRIEQIAIDDHEDQEGEGFSYGNDNSIIEPGESIEVTAYIQNFGEGDAENVKAEVKCNTSDRNITCTPDGKSSFNLEDIESGDYRKVEFYFFTSRRYSEENIPISIKLTESKGKFDKTVDLGLKLGKRSQNIVEVQVAKIETKKTSKIRQIEGIFKLSDVDKDIPTTQMQGENILAVIIGIEQYKYAPNVLFAERDAQTFYNYTKSVFGIPDRNIYLRINEGATSGEFHKIFAEDGWIARRLKKDKTEVIVYYSGHGAPDTKSKKGYLIPSDIDPNYASTGLSLDDMYSSLSKLEAKSVTVFLDACFSGESRSEEMLITGTRPVSILINNPILTSDKIGVFTASTGDQYSSAYPDKNHGLFTYYLLKALKGEACGDDRNLTLVELFEYVRENVNNTAGYLDKEQTPTFNGGNRKRVLVKY